MTSNSPNWSCPKRMWVLSMLSDDEALERLDALPMGLEFHLKQCSSCRALAEQLRAVDADLRNLAGTEVPAGLEQQAAAQALEALEAGAQPTGRVELADDPIDAEVSRIYRLRTTAALAAAAVVVFAVGAVLFFQVSDPDVPPGPLVNHTSARPEFVSEDDPPTEQDADQVQYVAQAPATPTSPRDRRVLAPRSYSEALEFDTEHSFQRATILRRPSEPGRAWHLLFDKPAPAQSTETPADEH